MKPDSTIVALALGRISLGFGLLLAPERTGRGWVGNVVDSPTGRLLVRSVGARDVVIGAGTVVALRSKQPVRRWLQAAMAADATDTLLTLLAFRHLPSPGRIVTIAMTAGAIAAAARAAGSVD